MTLPVVVVKKGREAPLRRHHPWVFSGALHKEPKVEPGALVDIRDAAGAFLGRGYYNVHSQIRARVLTWDESESIDAAFFRRRIRAAFARRHALLANPEWNDAARIVMSEADQLPGLIVDLYGAPNSERHVVVQALTAGIATRIELIGDVLADELGAAGIHERSDDAVRGLEGLTSVSRLLYGREPQDGCVVIHENGLRFQVDLVSGHKTGFYLDQRLNHQIFGSYVAELGAQAEVLDCFSYTGGFTLAAAQAGAAKILSIDASAAATARVQDHLNLNAYGKQSGYEQWTGNAFELLRKLRDEGRQFDAISLDPPKFAHHGGQVEQAARGYKDVNLLAFRLLRPGGILATFSCSGHISADLFQKIIFGAASDAGVEAQIVRYLTQAEDHPVLLSFPESLYLKGLLLRRLI